VFSNILWPSPRFPSRHIKPDVSISGIRLHRNEAGPTTLVTVAGQDRRFTFDMIHRELGVLCLQRMPRIASSRVLQVGSLQWGRIK
jgi:hypothetical protein